ncbi:MAG: class I SAM-dependent methyltransferase [Desulfobacteraceae bacterium]|nr:class I SAM-dependent methyltransferase [Desulfobacteraceae bacterium]
MTKEHAKSIIPASYWDKLYQRQGQVRQLRLCKWDHAFLAELSDHLGLFSKRRSTTFLEVGCAPAQFMIYFNQVFGWQVAGIELSEPGLVISKALLEANGVKARLYAGDIFEVEPDCQYDVVGSFGLVEHFDDPLPCYRAMMRWIRPGGAMIVTVPNLLGPEGWARRRRNYQHYLEHRCFSSVDLANHCRAVGLRVVFHGLVGNLNIPYIYELANSTRFQRLINFPARLVNGLVRRAVKIIKRPLKLGSFTTTVSCVAFKDE